LWIIVKLMVKNFWGHSGEKLRKQKLSSVNNINEKLHELISSVTQTHQTITQELKIIKNVLNDPELQWKENDHDNVVSGIKEFTQFDSKSADLSNADRVSVRSESSCGSSTTSSDISSVVPNDKQKTTSKSSKRSLKNHRSSNGNTDKTVRQVTFVEDNNTNNDDQTEAEDEQIITLNREEQSETVNNPANEENNENINEVDNRHVEQSYPIGPIGGRNLNESYHNASFYSELITPVLPIDRSRNTLGKSPDLISDLFSQHRSEVSEKHNLGYKMGSALTSIRIHEIEQNGDYLRLLNVSNSDDYDLSNHFIQQNVACLPVCRFRFPPQTVIRAGQTVTIWCGTKNIDPQPPHIFVWKQQRRWENSSECVTVLAKPSGQAIAWTRSSHRFNNNSSSDVLYIQSQGKSNSDADSVSSITKSRSGKLSAFSFVGNKPPFAHSTNSPVHPDHSAPMTRDIRTQMHTQWQQNNPRNTWILNRPKSSPFANHIGCKQDLISMNILQSKSKQKILKT
ncbi:unnamed protein product, partial [Didymodactylos carnosus]